MVRFEPAFWARTHDQPAWLCFAFAGTAVGPNTYQVCALPAACPALGEPAITVATAAVIAANLQTCFPVGLPVVVWTDMDTFRAQSEG